LEVKLHLPIVCPLHKCFQIFLNCLTVSFRFNMRIKQCIVSVKFHFGVYLRGKAIDILKKQWTKKLFPEELRPLGWYDFFGCVMSHIAICQLKSIWAIVKVFHVYHNGKVSWEDVSVPLCQGPYQSLVPKHHIVLSHWDI